jgi:hypothetical protein
MPTTKKTRLVSESVTGKSGDKHFSYASGYKLYKTMKNIEDGLLEAGATPGTDYNWQDLLQAAMQFQITENRNESIDKIADALNDLAQPYAESSAIAYLAKTLDGSLDDIRKVLDEFSTKRR